MTTTSQVRTLVLLSFLGSVLVTGGFFFVLRAQLAAKDEATPAPIVQRPVQEAATPAKPAKAKGAATTKAPATATKPAVKKAAAKSPRVLKGLPPALTAALKAHRVVVAVLAVPGADLDATVLDEATAGAKQAGVGFVSLDVLREKTGRALAAKLGVVETPTVVVYRRPGRVSVRFEGLVDRDTVAQAAKTAFGG